MMNCTTGGTMKLAIVAAKMRSRAVRDAVAMSSVFLKNGGSSSLIGNQSPASWGFVRSIYILRCRQATTPYSNSVGRANPKINDGGNVQTNKRIGWLKGLHSAVATLGAKAASPAFAEYAVAEQERHGLWSGGGGPSDSEPNDNDRGGNTKSSNDGDGLEIAKLGIDQEIVSALVNRGITKLFPIQWQWSACKRTQMLYQSQSLAPKSCLFSSVASPELSGKDSNPDSSVEDSVVANGDEKAEPVSPKQSDSTGKNKAVNGGKAEPNKTTQRKETYSDTDTDEDEDEDEENELSTEELLQLVRQKEDLLKAKHKEIEKMQEKVLRSYAEIENVMDRTRREAENSKKFAIQSFAKSLLDVADNLGRASSVVKESFSKIDASKDTDKAVPLLKTLLEGVEMTEKQLSEVFKKYGIERFDPINEHFDPHRHMAVFQVPDATKQPGAVAVVLKPGYTLHDRVIRPAEVGVVGDVQGEAGGSPGPST